MYFLNFALARCGCRAGSSFPPSGVPVAVSKSFLSWGLRIHLSSHIWRLFLATYVVFYHYNNYNNYYVNDLFNRSTAPVSQDLFIIKAARSHLVGLRWTSDRPVAESSAWHTQHSSVRASERPQIRAATANGCVAFTSIYYRHVSIISS